MLNVLPERVVIFEATGSRVLVAGCFAVGRAVVAPLPLGLSECVVWPRLPLPTVLVVRGFSLEKTWLLLASSSSLSRDELAERVRSVELDRASFTEVEEGVSLFAVELPIRDATLERVRTCGCPTDGAAFAGVDAFCPPTIVPMRLVFLRLVELLTLVFGIL